MNHPNDPDWVFTYDGSTALNQKGRLASVTNGIVTTSFEYTARGEVAVETTALDGKSYAVGYGYDPAGNVASITGPSGVGAATSYQGLRPKTVAITAGTQTETIRNLEFLPFGGRTRADFPPYNGASNVVLSTRAYNLRGQVTEIDVSAPTGKILDRSLTYDYTAASPGPNDPGPNLDRIIDHRDASQSRFYFYEDLDRLASAKTLAGAVVEGYLYDPVGNRTQKTTGAGTTTYSYETGTDRLSVAAGPEAKRYAHDAYGSRIYMGAAPYAGTPSLVYNDENRLVQAKDADAGFAVLGTYAYDAFGRRVKKVAAGKTELFFYDLAGHTIEILEVKAGTDRVRDLVFVEDEPMGFVDQDLEVGTALGPVGFEFDGRLPAIPVGIALGAVAGLALLSIPAIRRRPKSAVAAIALAAVAGGVSVARSQGGGATFYWIHTDHLGTPLAATDTPATPTNALPVWRALHLPFGQATVDEDPDGDLQSVSLPLRFPGQVYDSESGLHYNLRRTYDPNLGRYAEADPLGLPSAINIYAYASGAPLGVTDPSGLCPCGTAEDLISAARSDTRDWSRSADRSDVNSGFGAGTYKCNLFVDTQYEASGYNLPNIGGGLFARLFGRYPPGAQSLSSPSYSVPGWPIVSGPPVAGDLIAHQGHVGIATGSAGSISASPAGVLENDWGFRQDQVPVIRRCSCGE